MKRSLKRTLSVLLAVVMVISALPFTAISAFAEEDMSTELQTAISDYEEVMTKMTTDNKVYKNLTAAYDSYVKANRYVDAYKYGKKEITAAEFSAMTKELRDNTAAMTEWTAQKGEYKQGFSSGDTATNITANNSINILHTTQTTDSVGSSSGGNVNRIMYYSSAVLLYDGVTKPRMPIMMSAQVSGNKTRYLYAAYPVSSDVTDPRTMQAAVDHEDIILLGGWRGGTGTTLDWGWNYQQSGSPTAYTAGAGFAGLDNNGTNGVQTTSTRSTQLPKGNIFGGNGTLVMFSNALQLTDSFAFNDGEYYRNISANWYVSSSDSPNSGQDSGIIVPTATITILNYKVLIDALTGTKKAIFADFKNYKQGGLKALCSAFDTATSVDISDTTTSNVSVKAELIKTAVNGINNSTEPTKDATGYAALRKALDDTAKVYGAGNTNNANYTAETWGPFETAVLAAQSRMANLYSNAYSASDAALAEAEATTLTNAFNALVLNKVPVDTTSLDVIMYNAHVIAKNSNFFTAESMAASNIVELTRRAKIAIWQEEENYPLEAQKIADSAESRAIVASYVTSLSAAIRLCVLDYDANIAQIGYSLTGAVAKGQSYEATKDDYGNYAILDEAVKQGAAFMAKDNSIDPEVAENALNVITAYANATNKIIKAVNGLKPSFAKISNGTIANEGYTATTRIVSSAHSDAWHLTWNRSDQVIFFKTVREQSVFELPVSNMSFFNNCRFDAMLDSINLNSATDVKTGELSSKYSAGSGGTADPYGGVASYPGKTAITSGNLELKLAGIKVASSSGSSIAKDMAGNDITDINTDLTSLLETTEGTVPISGGILAKKGTTEFACKTTITAPQVTGSISEESIPSAKSCVFDISQSALTMGMFYYWKIAPTGASPYYAGWAYDTAKYTETVYVVDISTLLALIKECEALTDNSADYSTSSWNNFIGALSGAKAEMDYAGMTYSEIVGECDTRYNALWNARQALVAPASNKALSEALTAAKDAYNNDESKVKQSTWNAFKVAYQNAQAAYLGKYSDINIRNYDKTDATVIAEINELVTALNTAKNNLVYKIDFTADEFNVDGAVASLIASIANETYTATSVQAVANAISTLTYYNMSAIERATHYMDEADVVAAVKAEVIAIAQLDSQLVEGTVDASALEYTKAEGKSKLSDPDAYDQNEIAEKLAALTEFVDVNVAGTIISAYKYNTQEELDADVTAALSNISIQKYAVYVDGVEERVCDYGTQITVKSPTGAQVDWYYASASTTSTTANKYFTTCDEVTFIVKGETHLETKKASDTETVKVTYVNSINMKNVDVQYVAPGTEITLSVANAPSVVFYTCNGIQINGVSYNDGDTYVVNENVIVLYTYNRTVTQTYSVYVADIAYRFPDGDVLINDLAYNDEVSFIGAEYSGNDMVYHVNNEEQTITDCGRLLDDYPPVYAWVEVNASDAQAWRDAARNGAIIDTNSEFSEMAYSTNGKVVAYGTDYTFRVHKDVTLFALDEAAYKDAVAKGIVTEPGDDNGAKVDTSDELVITEGVKFAIISNFTVPENCKMVETGILFAANKNSSDIPTVDLTLGNAGTNGILRVKSTAHTPGNQYVISINTPKIAGKNVGEVGMKWVAYMTYTDKDGNMITVYSDPTSPTNTTDTF
ncbi:MAG: hypothetical protein PUE46_04635 [Eubacteriales bacterium]|nr:hypothetical protein [Eubacteriales bacterium]